MAENKDAMARQQGFRHYCVEFAGNRHWFDDYDLASAFCDECKKVPASLRFLGRTEGGTWLCFYLTDFGPPIALEAVEAAFAARNSHW